MAAFRPWLKLCGSSIMTQDKLAVVILAAGKGTRMTSDLSKVLHKVAGKTMLDHVLSVVSGLEPERIVLVAAPDFPEENLAGSFTTVRQDEPLGTGHATAAAKPALDGYHGADGGGAVLVVYGDTPLLTPETLSKMVHLHREPGGPDLVGLAFEPDDPAQYGRVVLDRDGKVLDIIEHADADQAVRAIPLCNGGVVLCDGPLLFELLARTDRNNAKGEYYLTDLYHLVRVAGRSSRMVLADPEEILGIDSRADLAVAEAIMQLRLRGRAMAEGATLVDPTTVWFSADTVLGRDVVVHPSVVFGPGVRVGDGAEIRSFSHLEGAEVGAGATIGPFARLRPGTTVGADARVGNFVEVKNVDLGPGAKANHLSYLGDATVGEGANIGAGTITCNYDGFTKHRTQIGAGAFIGTNSSLVAPVTVGDNANVGAGSTITQDVPADALAVARAKQEVRPEAAARYRARRRKAKEKDT
jgi:bifunctional UDP-N-acetylglucosamine pyrophosphorylase/glucosamine-1-phosphate N-acetyltransferase